MPSKSPREKKRYIAFRITAPYEVSRKEFITAIREGVKDRKQWEEMKPWLTVFQGNEGILRCIHTSKDEAISLLTSIKEIGPHKVPVSVETISTSGTIKKVKKRVAQ